MRSTHNAFLYYADYIKLGVISAGYQLWRFEIKGAIILIFVIPLFSPQVLWCIITPTTGDRLMGNLLHEGAFYTKRNKFTLFSF